MVTKTTLSSGYIREVGDPISYTQKQVGGQVTQTGSYVPYERVYDPATGRTISETRRKVSKVKQYSYEGSGKPVQIVDFAPYVFSSSRLTGNTLSTTSYNIRMRKSGRSVDVGTRTTQDYVNGRLVLTGSRTNKFLDSPKYDNPDTDQNKDKGLTGSDIKKSQDVVMRGIRGGGTASTAGSLQRSRDVVIRQTGRPVVLQERIPFVSGLAETGRPLLTRQLEQAPGSERAGMGFLGGRGFAENIDRVSRASAYYRENQGVGVPAFSAVPGSFSIRDLSSPAGSARFLSELQKGKEPTTRVTTPKGTFAANIRVEKSPSLASPQVVGGLVGSSMFVPSSPLESQIPSGGQKKGSIPTFNYGDVMSGFGFAKIGSRFIQAKPFNLNVDVVKAGGIATATQAISFTQQEAEKGWFGKAYDWVDTNFQQPVSRFISPALQPLESGFGRTAEFVQTMPNPISPLTKGFTEPARKISLVSKTAYGDTPFVRFTKTAYDFTEAGAQVRPDVLSLGVSEGLVKYVRTKPLEAAAWYGGGLLVREVVGGIGIVGKGIQATYPSFSAAAAPVIGATASVGRVVLPLAGAGAIGYTTLERAQVAVRPDGTLDNRLLGQQFGQIAGEIGAFSLGYATPEIASGVYRGVKGFVQTQRIKGVAKNVLRYGQRAKDSGVALFSKQTERQLQTLAGKGAKAWDIPVVAEDQLLARQFKQYTITAGYKPTTYLVLKPPQVTPSTYKTTLGAIAKEWKASGVKLNRAFVGRFRGKTTFGEVPGVYGSNFGITKGRYRITQSRFDIVKPGSGVLTVGEPGTGFYNIKSPQFDLKDMQKVISTAKPFSGSSVSQTEFLQLYIENPAKIPRGTSKLGSLAKSTTKKIGDKVDDFLLGLKKVDVPDEFLDLGAAAQKARPKGLKRILPRGKKGQLSWGGGASYVDDVMIPRGGSFVDDLIPRSPGGSLTDDVGKAITRGVGKTKPGYFRARFVSRIDPIKEVIRGGGSAVLPAIIPPSLGLVGGQQMVSNILKSGTMPQISSNIKSITEVNYGAFSKTNVGADIGYDFIGRTKIDVVPDVGVDVDVVTDYVTDFTPRPPSSSEYRFVPSTPVPTPGFIGGWVPSLPGADPKYKSPKRGKRGRRSLRYQPSLFATAQGIRAKGRPAYLTGLEVRPILSSASSGLKNLGVGDFLR